MAIVIQKMVIAESAGVLFTRHPLNGDPSVIVITANYGLGESVVSAKADPDTYFVRRSHKDELDLLGSKMGEKKVLIQMDARTVNEIEIDEEKRKTLCLSEENVLKLSKLGVIMEKFFGTPRDIEFAVTKDNKIYLLQSRPITALNNFSDYEIIHENDSAVMSVENVITKANVGEVILGSVSVLTQSTIIDMLEKNLVKSFRTEKHYTGLYRAVFPILNQQLFFNMGPVSQL